MLNFVKDELISIHINSMTYIFHMSFTISGFFLFIQNYKISNSLFHMRPCPQTVLCPLKNLSSFQNCWCGMYKNMLPKAGTLFTQTGCVDFCRCQFIFIIPLAQWSFTLSVCPSVRLSICGHRVRSVSSTTLAGSISYLHISSSNLRSCVTCKVGFF